ncbi:hypothetical protein [Butyrivibrio sp. YAB3001]|uniref:hypothetical protein n=1 Tax=Butyrivibrio sp. YAB3001 TaxID=1520812 RepID=UPI0008F65223|nr:hypothetical protein [Butyrivibrio sp. YAB3001]SFC95385.1 hypothetical protein SAMN02910398_03621 [Butyrivibrio sp. YAB3001]
MKRLLVLFFIVLVLCLPITSYAAGAKSYESWAKSTANKIKDASAGKKVTIKGGEYTSFSPGIRDAMIERPDVQVTVKWKKNGEDMKFVIRAGTDVAQVFDENGYAGFEYLQGFFGENGKTDAAKAILTRKAEAKNMVTVLNLKNYAGNSDQFNAYNYYTRYADLQTAIGPDGDKLLEHYNNYGIAEGRVGK